MDRTLLQATGEFDPIGTLVTLALFALFAYAAYWALGALGGNVSGLNLWGLRALVVVSGGLAVLICVAFLMQLAAAVGVL